MAPDEPEITTMIIRINVEIHLDEKSLLKAIAILIGLYFK